MATSLESSLADLGWNDLKRYAKVTCWRQALCESCWLTSLSLHQEQGVKAQGTREEITRELLDTIGDENAPVPVNDIKASMLSPPNKLSMP